MEIVISSIKTSHELVAGMAENLGAVGLGGMYGVIPRDGNPESNLVAIIGLVKDVISQLRRGLHGFWIGYVPFIRPAIAIAQAFQESKDSNVMDSMN